MIEIKTKITKIPIQLLNRKSLGSTKSSRFTSANRLLVYVEVKFFIKIVLKIKDTLVSYFSFLSDGELESESLCPTTVPSIIRC